MKRNPSKTQQVIYSMLTENTGRSMLDSGGAYGRSWERNQGKSIQDFMAEPEFKFGVQVRSFRPLWPNAPATARHEEIKNAVISTFHFLVKALDFDANMDKLFHEVFVPMQGEYDTWFDLVDNFTLWLDKPVLFRQPASTVYKVVKHCPDCGEWEFSENTDTRWAPLDQAKSTLKCPSCDGWFDYTLKHRQCAECGKRTENYAQHIQHCKDEHGQPDEKSVKALKKARLYTEFAEKFGEIDGDVVTENTCNHQSSLSQVIQYTTFTFDGTEYAALFVHGGCDVRGGYTRPRFFRHETYGEHALHNDSRFSIGCGNGHTWDTFDAGYSWEWCGNTNPLDGTYQAEPFTKYPWVTETEYAEMMRWPDPLAFYEEWIKDGLWTMTPEDQRPVPDMAPAIDYISQMEHGQIILEGMPAPVPTPKPVVCLVTGEDNGMGIDDGTLHCPLCGEPLEGYVF